MSHPNGTKSAATPTQQSASSLTEVFAVHGVEPEVQAYAMAKYSRSALSMKESLKEISEQKAEQFLNTFYFQYGHRSIAVPPNARSFASRRSRFESLCCRKLHRASISNDGSLWDRNVDKGCRSV